MKTLALWLAVSAAVISPAFAAHNNPWAKSEDTVLAKDHDENQEQSIDTVGEDEMLGNLVQNVSSSAGDGDGGGDGGGDGEGGGGHGDGGQGR